ncbi:MAG: DUF4349 domain-containing protein [Treponema sp.]|nr:DUF4349 domain-containing protein [Treponema sp.]
MIVSGCSEQAANRAMGWAPGYAADYQEESQSSLTHASMPKNRGNDRAAAANDDAAQYAEPGNSVQRKLVKRANISIRAENLAAAENSINALIEQHGAYAASTTINENYRNYEVRVPSSAHDRFLSTMSGVGRILEWNESAEDVTLRYYDLEGRLATKQELLKTFQSYLGKAKNIEEILSVEERILDLQSEIDNTGRDLRLLGDLVDYSTIGITIYGPVAALPSSRTTLTERVRELFSGFGVFLSTVALVLLGIVIYGIPLLLLLTLLFWLLFGRIGLLKKLWFITAGKDRRGGESNRDAGGKTEL